MVINNDWSDYLKDEFEQPYYKKLQQFLKAEYNNHVIYPEKSEVFSALNLTPFAQTKVVILGQDPYHSQGQAHGLSFSVKPGIALPPSLRNIYKELLDDIGHAIPNHGCLVPWAQQGVLMLNTVLTVRRGEPNSHKEKGWETFTDQVINSLNLKEQPIVFMLWGKYAQGKMDRITSPHHYIIQSPHPSPFAARKGFFGSKPFSRTNSFLKQIGRQPIDWNIPQN